MFFQARTERSSEAGRHVLPLNTTSKGETRSNEHYRKKNVVGLRAASLKSFARYEVVVSLTEKRKSFSFSWRNAILITLEIFDTNICKLLRKSVIYFMNNLTKSHNYLRP